MKKICLIILLCICCTAAVPADQQYRLKRKVTSASENDKNLVEATTKEGITAAPVYSTLATNVQQMTTSSTNNTTSTKEREDIAENAVDSSNSPSNPKLDNALTSSNVLQVEARVGQTEETELPPLHADEFKVKILEPTNPSQDSYQQNLIKTPDFYVVKVPHYIVIKESDFLRNYDYGIPSFTGSFYPFQEIPSLSHDFSIDNSGFGTQGSYPIYPLEIPQNVEQSPIISIGDHIPEISDFQSITGGVEILNLDRVNVEQQNDQVVDHENESIAVEALEKANQKNQSTKNSETLTEEPKSKQN